MNLVLKKLNDTNVGLNLDKCEILLRDNNWLGFYLSAEGSTPLRYKLDSIQHFAAPTTRKQLRGLMGAANQWNKLIHNLAQL